MKKWKRKNKLLTTKEVADLFGVGEHFIWDLVRKKLLLPCIRFGQGELRFAPQAIEKFIASGGNQEDETRPR